MSVCQSVCQFVCQFVSLHLIPPGKSMSVQWARRPRKHLPSRATTNDKCYVCNRYGHFARDCPDIGTAPSGSGSGSNRSRNRRSPYRSRDYSPRRRSRSPPRRRSRSRSPYNSRRCLSVRCLSVCQVSVCMLVCMSAILSVRYVFLPHVCMYCTSGLAYLSECFCIAGMSVISIMFLSASSYVSM